MAQTKILVVEDDAPIRRALVDALRFAGYAVEECATGDRAVEAACAQSPDLLLLDIVLPGKDGFERLSKSIRVSVDRASGNGRYVNPDHPTQTTGLGPCYPQHLPGHR